MNSTVNHKPSNERAASSEAVRLHVYLAHSGVASRRAAEKLIAEGRITVNGRQVTVPGERVLPGDEVRFDGKQVKTESRLLYLVLNKPPMYITTSSDPQGRQLALDLLPPCPERLYSVGRLDYRSSGLIIFTNDGNFAARAGHPSAEIEKEYLVESTVPIPDMAVEEFARGVIIEGVLYRAQEIEKTGRKSLRVVLIEGKNREIRRVFSHFHLHPEKLQRIRIGAVKLGNLAEGQSRALTNNEFSCLMGRRERW
ncbi:MAG: rRNA pseudouridine synthase [Treponema sp.]|nr:rRNA pseudouridine synthase [Treponema sp.]